MMSNNNESKFSESKNVSESKTSFKTKNAQYKNSYKRIFNQKSNNKINKINSVLSFMRRKKLLNYIKDGTIKSEMEYPISSDGIIYVDNIQKMVYISVHLSNTEAKLVWQLANLVKIVSDYPDYIIHIIGDFNVVPMKDTTVDNRLYFLKKNEKLESLNDTKKIEILRFESKNITCDFSYHKVLFKETDFNTTCKVRIITAQIDKMFEVASDKIDSTIVLYPNNSEQSFVINHSLHYFTNNTDNTIVENTVTENTLYPVEWLSDHSLLKSTITIGNEIGEYKNKTVISLNVSGESQSSEKAYNWAEFAIKDFYDFITQHKSLPEIKNEIFTSTEIFGIPVTINDKPVTNLSELVKKDKKYFSESFKNKGLRDCDAVNYHRDPDDTKEIIQYYQELSTLLNTNLLKNGNIDGTYTKFLKLQNIFSRIMKFNFQNKYNEDVSLNTIFNSWYTLSQNINKIKILDVLEYYLSRDIDVIALQEVSIVGGTNKSILYFIQNLIITKYTNYILVKPLYNYVEDKTVGILIIKK